MHDDTPPSTAMTRDRFDANLAQAMGDIPIPVGLTARLQVAVHAQEAQRAGDAAPHTGATNTRTIATAMWARRRLLSGCAAVTLLAAWTWFAPHPSVVTEADVRRLARLDQNLLVSAPSEARCAVPIGWQSVRGLELSNRLVVTPRDTLAVQLLPLTYQVDRRSPRVTGLLLPLHESSWRTSLARSPFSVAEVRYTTSGTWVVWREGSTVFVLILHGEAPVMERLQHAATSRRDLT